MRDIKFRAWNIRYKKMQVVERMWIPEDKPILGVHNDKFSIGTNWLNGEYELEFELMQYTGLKDSKGKEIYEGDILKDEFGRVCLVYWIEEEARFALRQKHRRTEYFMITNHLIEEIIGNIYENPELLEV